MLISKLMRKPQKKAQNLEFALFSITNLLKFSANNFFQSHLFPIISTDLNTHMQKNNQIFLGVIEYKESMF
jgi:hypothetical protein